MSLLSDPLSTPAGAPLPEPPQEAPRFAIIFDLDDTLAFTAPHWRRAEEALLRRLGRAWSSELALKYKGMNTLDVAAVIHREFNPDLPLAECQRIVRDALLESLRAGPITAMPGAAVCVRRAERIAPLAIASGSPLEAIEIIVEELGIADAFEVKVSSESVRRGKPFPDVFFAAAEELGVPAESCLVFEDSLVGAEAARSAGMSCIAVPSSRPEEVLEVASRCFSSLNDVSGKDIAACLPSASCRQFPFSVRKASTAFSLLELLIGIATVAVLATLAFVAFGAAREMNKQTVCASNLRTLATAVISYATEHNGRFPPPFGEGAAVTWDGVVAPYFGHHDLKEPTSLLHCPADPRPIEASPGKYRRSYKLSSQPAQNYESPMGVVGYYDDPSGAQKYLSVVRRQIDLTHPSDTILIFEHFTTNTVKSEYSDHYQFATSNSIGSGWRNKNRIVGHLPNGRFYHGKGIAFAMADGHVEIQHPSWAYTPHVRWDIIR